MSESIPNANGWVNPYRYDGCDGVRSDVATGLDWMRVRAYDPSLGRFLARDPLGRAPLFLSDNPYVYAGNNPLSNVDPSGQYRATGQGAGATPESWSATKQMIAHIVSQSGCDKACQAQRNQERAQAIARSAAAYFSGQSKWLPGSLLHLTQIFDSGLILGLLGTIAAVPTLLKTLGQVAVNYAAASGNGILGVLGELAPLMYIGALLDIVLYDLVANAYQYLFQKEATTSDTSWANAGGIGYRYALMIGISMVASLTALAFAGFEAVLMPDVAPFWAATALVTVALIMNNLQHYAESYVDQEEAVFGYALS